jgi:DNA replication factor GINS
MYSELYEAWKQEIQNAELTKLPTDFYASISDYIRKLRDEGRMLDKRTAKANLLKKEIRNVKRMVRELIQTRHRKLIYSAAKSEKIASDVLTVEEEKIYASISDLQNALHSLTKNILQGQGPKFSKKQSHNRTVVRLLSDIPAIVGSDMKTYGPFKIEDVASLPAENAEIFVKQKLAEKIEIE